MGNSLDLGALYNFFDQNFGQGGQVKKAERSAAISQANTQQETNRQIQEWGKSGYHPDLIGNYPLAAQHIASMAGAKSATTGAEQGAYSFDIQKQIRDQMLRGTGGIHPEAVQAMQGLESGEQANTLGRETMPAHIAAPYLGNYGMSLDNNTKAFEQQGQVIDRTRRQNLGFPSTVSGTQAESEMQRLQLAREQLKQQGHLGQQKNAIDALTGFGLLGQTSPGLSPYFAGIMNDAGYPPPSTTVDPNVARARALDEKVGGILQMSGISKGTDLNGVKQKPTMNFPTRTQDTPSNWGKTATNSLDAFGFKAGGQGTPPPMIQDAPPFPFMDAPVGASGGMNLDSLDLNTAKEIIKQLLTK